MTQFIIVTGEPSGGNPPPGIVLRPVEPSSFVARTATSLLSSHDTCLSKVAEHESGEADRLIDDMYNARRDGDASREPILLQFLRVLVSEGRSVVCWYGDDVSDVPIFRTWTAFAEAVLRDATKQPPEVYAIIQSSPMAGSSARSNAD